MGPRVALLLFLLALAHMAASSSSSRDSPLDALGISREDGLEGQKSCNGSVGECIDEEEEMSSEISRRVLKKAKKYISYGALKYNQIPCSRRGASYYNCRQHGRINPYKRACTVITGCLRDMNS